MKEKDLDPTKDEDSDPTKDKDLNPSKDRDLDKKDEDPDPTEDEDPDPTKGNQTKWIQRKRIRIQGRKNIHNNKDIKEKDLKVRF